MHTADGHEFRTTVTVLPAKSSTIQGGVQPVPGLTDGVPPERDGADAADMIAMVEEGCALG